MVRYGESATFVVAVFLVGVVESLEEGFLLVVVILSNLSLG